MAVFCLYAVLLLGMGILDAKRSRSADAFFVNNRSSGAWLVGISIVASCVGGSATIGMAGLAWQIGTPAFWWLGSGACGLIVLTVFLARKVRATGAYTMPEMVNTYLGPSARTVVSLIITVAWLGILAAQFTAMGKITAALTGLSSDTALLAGAALIVAYSFLGGQASVIRSDLPQFLILFAGLCAVLGWLISTNSQPLSNVPLEFVNDGFTFGRLSYFMIILGGSYIVCPMLFGRLLSARDMATAVRGGWIGVVGLTLTAIVIVCIGICGRGLVPAGTAPDDVLTSMLGFLPPWASMALMVALLSAVLSSADTCLITASTVCSHDLIRSENIAICRAVTLALGVGGWLLALRGHGILNLLLMANDVYVCGVVAPVFFGMLLHGRVHFTPRNATLAVVLGGCGGIVSAVCQMPEAGYAGMALAACCLFASSRRMVQPA